MNNTKEIPIIVVGFCPIISVLALIQGSEQVWIFTFLKLKKATTYIENQMKTIFCLGQ